MIVSVLDLYWRLQPSSKTHLYTRTMKNTVAITFTAALLTAAAFIVVPSCKNSPEPGKGPQPMITAAVMPGCNCEADWFPHSQTPAPAEGNGSPFDTSSTTNCIFHQWSWQKFLWLTKPMATGNPLFLDSMIQVSNQMVPVSPVGGISLVLEDSTQAGSKGVLVSNPAYAADQKSHTVYYSIFINPVLQTAANSMKDQILSNNALVNNNFVFPVGSLELKVSWVDASALPAAEVKNYYTTTAVVMPGNKKITAALLGMHVVGVVKNHPEFIWATFEHHDMAPDYNWKNTTTQDIPVTSDMDKLFFKKGDTATWQNLQYKAGQPAPPDVFTVYKLGIPRIANDSFMQVSQSEPINFNNVTALNACVAANLKDVWQNYFYNGSTWINTDGLTAQQQADTIVSLGYNIGNATPGSVARGCLAAFNITMETFVQAGSPLTQMNPTTLTNCFSCHSSPSSITLGSKTTSGTSPLYLSHIFRSYLSVSTGVPVNKIEQLRTRDFIEMMSVKNAAGKK